MLEMIVKGIEDSATGVFMRENGIAFPMVESIHVLALTLMVGSIGIVDLRLLGVSANNAVTKVSAELLPVTWMCFVAAVISGFLMFTSQAVNYSHNIFFLTKMVLIILAAANMMIFELITCKGVGSWDIDTPTPLPAKVAGGLSLAFWISVIVAGRWIGFV